jgi:hypothetical protein
MPYIMCPGGVSAMCKTKKEALKLSAKAEKLPFEVNCGAEKPKPKGRVLGWAQIWCGCFRAGPARLGKSVMMWSPAEKPAKQAKKRATAK